MNIEREKEYRLHKVAAASAFVCALCILPLAQYLLSTHSTGEQGKVAGVSTDSSIVTADVPVTGAACQTKKQQDLADLDKWIAGETAHINLTYEAAVKPFRDTEAQNPNMDQADKTALDNLITSTYIPYGKRLEAAESAEESQKNVVASRSCGP